MGKGWFLCFLFKQMVLGGKTVVWMRSAHICRQSNGTIEQTSPPKLINRLILYRSFEGEASFKAIGRDQVDLQDHGVVSESWQEFSFGQSRPVSALIPGAEAALDTPHHSDSR